MKLFFYAALCSLPTFAFSDACPITDFKDEYLLQEDKANALAFYYNMSETEYDRRGKDGELHGSIDLFGGAGSYSEMREKVKASARSIGLSDFSESSKYLMYSKLNPDVVRFYEACIGSPYGIKTNEVDIRSSRIDAAVQYIAYPDCDPDTRLELKSTKNIENLDEIEKRINDVKGCGSAEMELSIHPEELVDGGYIIFGTGVDERINFPPLAGYLKNSTGRVHRSAATAECPSGHTGNLIQFVKGGDLSFGLIATGIEPNPRIAVLEIQGQFADIDFNETIEVSAGNIQTLELPTGRTIQFSVDNIEPCSAGYNIAFVD